MSPVYPQRILDAPQPPDGPRMWACPLAVVDWSGGSPTVTDCRPQFANLGRADGGGGRLLQSTSRPADVDGGGGLQALIDKYAVRDR